MAVTNDNTLEKSSFRIAKRIILYIFIYLIGYFNCSITWILILVFATTLSEDYLNFKNRKRTFAKKTANENEKDVILENLGELPSWVVFPDVERAEWLNKIVKQCWPFVNYYARDLVRNYLEIKLKKNLEKYGLKGFHFERIILGSVPCRTGGIIVYDNVSREEIVMDIDITYAGDCDVKFRLRGLLGGIKNLQMYGTLRVVLKPLIRHLPLIGGVQLFFLNNPDIDFDLDGIAGILDIPGINECLRKCICATVGSLFVLPNKFPLKFCREVSSEQLNTPNPAGVLRVHVIEAKDLLKKDLSFTGKSKSDPYAVLVVGEQSFKTETIPSNVNPKWDYWCEFVILEFTGQELLISVWDEDPTEDEFLGRASIAIASLIKEGISDMWLVLEDVKHGDIHIRTTWLTLTTEYSNLKAALYESQQLQLSHMSSSLLIVYIDSATNLKQVRTSTKPDPYVQLQLGRQIKTSNCVMRTVNPVWEEGFIFMVANPDSDYLNLKIFDAKTEAELTEVSYNVSGLCDKENLEIEKESLRLEFGRTDCKLIWSLHLKIFHNNNFQEYLEKRPSSRNSMSSIHTIERDLTDSESISSDSTKYSSHSRRHTKYSLKSNNSFCSRTSQESYGDINLTMRYSLQRQRLIVVVHRVCNLYFEDPTEDKDIYVKIYLLPERCKANKRKTKVIKNCREPAFDKRFEFLVAQDDLNDKYLEVSVIEEKVIKNEILGQVSIDLKNISLPITRSFKLGPSIKHD
ncbi:extended synaptotagmin-2-like isoform X2 [Diorhabda carinulata]|uniref:extended synaptotagmin-2-like isoform X2 n=1 Tax=Diorhabda carinulata TaxID=1163345 RepID=UPI0025A2C4ED|nr:extended synaptotagmin-2-like isoform X2 [Diorhabda carinulata]